MAKDIDFKVVNILGKLVYSTKIKAKYGDNLIDLNTSDYVSGIYFYTLSAPDLSVTRTMVIQ